jgi:hypothetical protein
LPTNYISGNISLNSASTVIYNSDQPQNFDVVNFGNLTSSGSGSRTFPNGQTVGIAGTFTKGTNSYTITGSTINFNGSASQTIPAFNYNNLTSSSSGGRTLASSGTIGVAGIFTPGSNSYTITGSTIDFNGSGSQTVAALDYDNLTLSASGTKTFAGGTTRIAGNLVVSGATGDGFTNSTIIEFNGTGAQAVGAMTYYDMVFTNSGIKTISSTVTAIRNVLVNVTADVRITNPGVFTVYGDIDNSGAITNDGTIDMP